MYYVSLHNIYRWRSLEISDHVNINNPTPYTKHTHSDQFYITCLVTELTIKGATIQKLEG